MLPSLPSKRGPLLDRCYASHFSEQAAAIYSWKSARWVAMSCIMWIFAGWCWHVTWCPMTGSFGICFFRPCKVPMELRGVWRWRRTAWRWMGEDLWRLRARISDFQPIIPDPRFRFFTTWMQLVTLNCPLHHKLWNYVSTTQLWLQHSSGLGWGDGATCQWIGDRSHGSAAMPSLGTKSGLARN